MIRNSRKALGELVMASLRNWLERSLLWRVWERMLEIEFIDRSIAVAGKGFAAFFPLLIVVAAYLPAGRARPW